MAVNEVFEPFDVYQTEEDRRKMIPSFVDVTDVKRVDSAGFNAQMVNGRPVYEYTVSWTSKSAATMERWNGMTQVKEINGEMELVPCDGSCGHSVLPMDVIQFGNCDHNICRLCLEKTPHKVMYDGSPACCNELCLQISARRSASRVSNAASSASRSSSVASSGYQPSSAPSASKTSNIASSASFTSFSQMFVASLRILIFNMEKGHISRRQGVCEVNSNTTLNEIKDKIAAFVPNLNESTLFFTTRRDFRRSDLVKISLDEMTDERDLGDLEDDEYFTFIVACPGVTICSE